MATPKAALPMMKYCPGTLKHKNNAIAFFRVTFQGATRCRDWDCTVGDF